MPQLGSGSGKSAAAERKIRVKRKAAPKVKAPSKTQVRNAQAQQRQYVSQGRSVERTAKTQRRTAQAKAQEQEHVSQGKAVEKAAGEQRRTNRIKYLRRTRPTGLKLVDKVATDLIKGATIPSTGAGPNLGGRGNRPFTRVKAPRGAAAALAPKPVTLGEGRAASKVGLNFTKDVFTFPAQAVSSTYDVAAAGVEAAQGKTARIKRIAKSVDEGDPVYNTGAAAVAAVKGDSKGAKKRLDRAGKAVVEHPGLTALEVLGVKGTVGRGAGRVMRSGVAGKTAKRAASTTRESRQVDGTRIVQKRAYSPDVTRKARQVATEKYKRRQVVKLNQKAAKATGERAEALREKAARKNPDRLPEKEIVRQVDETIAASEDIRRIHRAKVTGQVRAATKKADAVTVARTQGIVRADAKDIRQYITELEAEYPNLTGSKARANRALRENLATSLEKGDLKLAEAQAREFQQITAPLQKKLVKRGLLDKEQEQRATLTPYAVRRMGATQENGRMVRPVTRVRAGGKAATENVPLRPEAVRAHMKLTGEKTPAFVTQAPNSRGARNFNVRSERPATIAGPKRSGEATRQGTFDADPEVLVEQAARSQGLVDATDGFRRTIKQFAHRDPAGKLRTFNTRKEADRALDALALDKAGRKRPGAVKMRAVRVNPWGASKEQLQKLIDDADTPDAQETVLHEMQAALRGEGGNGKWALIPEAAAERVIEHLNTQGGSGGLKTLQVANQAFRKTVLSTSTSWFAGNSFEGLLRASLAKAGPRSYVTGRRVMKAIDPKKVEEAAVRMVGGGHFSTVDRMHIRRGAEQFQYTKLAPLATALGKLWRTPGPKQVAGMWNAYTEWVFHYNSKLESTIQTAMLGKAIRDSDLMSGHLLKTSKSAVEDAAKGLKNTENQIAFGRAVDDMYGRYSKFSPSLRKAFATYTPFAAWFLNSAYFVYRTLPRDHPTVTALIAASEQATEEWRKDHGLDLWMQGAVPGFLQGSVPVKDGGKLRVNKFTPFGAFGDVGDTASSQVLPLAAGVLSALKGKDWKGDDLRWNGQPADQLQRFLLAARSFAEATVPVVSQAERVKDQGPQAFNPLKVARPKKSTRKKKFKVYKSGAAAEMRKSSSSSSGSGGGFFNEGSGSTSSGSSGGGGFFNP